ncbi:hypothetical protein L1D54_22500 [Vibrio brasiliensis]|uniref:hypothetical protein n=1 Tax=Vibrio brasiliensis TaxID=170652 RepID=UPI001EFD166E|nr:hypothetical protein [Vibrio brasiliensis]MCG9753214.1 hypothetical protein [Vibrio brasiliensis]
MQFGYVPPRQALAENLLINPRGIINQASEPDGVIAAGDYFCDGWKAGAAGCEVYRLAGGGFDLRSGSIVQLIPNNLEASRLVRTNLDIVTGSPVIKVNGSTDKAQAGAGEYIEIEISGDNSKFNRIVAADSKAKPIYQQVTDELDPCRRYYQYIQVLNYTTGVTVSSKWLHIPLREMAITPAISFKTVGSITSTTLGTRVTAVSNKGFFLYKQSGDNIVESVGGRWVIDGRL